MKDFEVQELSVQEMKATDGGIVVTLCCIAGALLLSGCAVLKKVVQ